MFLFSRETSKRRKALEERRKQAQLREEKERQVCQYHYTLDRESEINFLSRLSYLNDVRNSVKPQKGINEHIFQYQRGAVFHLQYSKQVYINQIQLLRLRNKQATVRLYERNMIIR